MAATGITLTGTHAVIGILMNSPLPLIAVLVTVVMALALRLNWALIWEVMTALGIGPIKTPATELGTPVISKLQTAALAVEDLTEVIPWINLELLALKNLRLPS